MARYNKRENNRVQFYNSGDVGLERTFVRQPSLVDSFYFVEGKCPRTGKKTVSFSHPLYMLFNQERLDRLGSAAVQQWIQSLNNAKNSSLNELRSKLSDDDLLSMVKSRHIQHPCELEAYIRSLNERADYFNSEVARIVAEQKAEQEKLELNKDIDEPKPE